MLSLFLLIVFFLIFPRQVNAAGEFDVFYNTTYTFAQNGDAQVVHEITLKNNFSTIYASSYGLVLEGKKPLDVVSGKDDTIYETQVESENEQTKITINFPDAVVGKGKERIFFVKYTIPRLATRNGQVWDLTIPRIGSPETINQYDLTFATPLSFGKPAYVFPQPRSQSQKENYNIFTFGKEDIARTGIVAAFGDFQVFKLSIQYHLENPNASQVETEIALVPDTAFQRVYYESITPKPRSIRLDEDGNWLALYRLAPKERLDVKASLIAQLYAKPQEFYFRINPQDKPYYTQSTKYWQTDDPAIIKAAAGLETPRAIYDFVVSTLSYDYSRVQEGVERLGAAAALAAPENAICMEFTDLFIALARNKGIPAREVNGFAYTENPKIQPLSLVSDVLHAWPEYWDSRAGVWRPVDPTWGKTTGGVDFFNKLDLSHIVFAIHGKDPEYPPPAGSYKLAANPQKDIQVEFGKLPENRTSKLTLELIEPKFLIPFVPASVKAVIYNPGPTARYNVKANINLSQTQIDFIAPFSQVEIPIEFTPPFLNFGQRSKIEVQVDETSVVYAPDQLKLNVLRVVILFGLLTVVCGMAIFIAKLLPKRLYGKSASASQKTS